jgi:hypothetical protein
MKIEMLLRGLKRSVGIGRPTIADLVAPAVGILTLGIMAGAAIVLLLSPTSAREARREVEHKLSGVKSRMLDSAEKMGERIGITPANAQTQQHRS